MVRGVAGGPPVDSACSGLKFSECTNVSPRLRLEDIPCLLWMNSGGLLFLIHSWPRLRMYEYLPHVSYRIGHQQKCRPRSRRAWRSSRVR